jgi:glycosyltransferase involved in cell wall biosynthesis
MRILCVHPHFELYGSDRCFVDSVQAIRKFFPTAKICVVIPRDGPLAEVLRPFADELRVKPPWVVRKRGLGRLLATAIFTFPLAFGRAVAGFRRNDLVYINTITLLDYLIAAAFFKRKALLHVHEAPDGLIGLAFGALVRAVGAPTIFNSESTRRAYRPHDQTPSYILYNGVKGPQTVAPVDYDGATRRLRLLMIGRLSHAKGQDLLIDACGLLPPSALEKIEVRIVGSSFGAQLKLEEGLRRRANNLGRPELFSFEPFVADPSALYEWCDLAVVPSRVREGFGRIAIEAMAHGRASIVAGHGGLSEIVVNEATGWHFARGDAQDLAAVIFRVLLSPDKIRRFGEAGRHQFEKHFTAAQIERRLQAIIRQRLTAPNSRGKSCPMRESQLLP